jgi:AraC-like DNA-binding protein
MTYKQFLPDAALAAYVDAFWTVTGEGREAEPGKILPDGCIDLIVNLGDNCKANAHGFVMRPDKTYLVGTMTRYAEIETTAATHLVGVRFKPAAISAFYQFGALQEVTNQVVEVDRPCSFDLQQIVQQPTCYLNQYLLSRLSPPNHPLIAIANDIQQHGGQTAVRLLAQKHHMTICQLERGFWQHVGISPKAFSNLVRYRVALKLIQTKSQRRSLLDIVAECGYYDHAHLTNAIRQYTGQPPSGF